MNFKIASALLEMLGLLPLGAYPAVLVANAMQAAALADASQRAQGLRVKRWLTGTFVGGTMAYPLVLLVCRALAGRAQKRGAGSGELAWSAAPLAFLGALAALFAVTLRVENREKGE